MRFSPGCNCCGSGCIEYIETLEDSASLSNFTQVSGTWTPNGINTSTTNDFGQLIYDPTVPVVDNFWLRVQVSDNNASIYRLIFDWDDSNNYWFAEFTYDGGTEEKIFINQVSGGTSAVKASGIFGGIGEDFPQKLTVCYQHNGIFAYFNSVYATYPASGLFGKFGIGTGDLPSTTASFHDFEIKLKTNDVTCGECPGTNCGCNAGIPPYFQVALTGITNGIFGCTSCNNLNGTHFVIFHSTFLETINGNQCQVCRYVKPYFSTGGCSHQIIFDIARATTGSIMFLRVIISSLNLGVEQQYLEQISGPIDCFTLNQSVSIVSPTISNCDYTSSSCTVSA